MAVLERLVAINPTVQWWIKGDGTDVVKGLWQSVLLKLLLTYFLLTYFIKITY